MALVVNHNMMAANTARMLNTNYNKLNTSVQRLSSGLRINSAADDAAGLAIRELMRSDITTLNQGIRNANDAISLIQTADGALSVIDEKLIRMKELAEQAATGTYNSTQRLIINSEFEAMGMEIDRIANATDFNGIHLLNGSLAGEHDGSGLDSKGALKVHFGTGNDSAEDYYCIDIADCTLLGLGLGVPRDRESYDPDKLPDAGSKWWRDPSVKIDWKNKSVEQNIDYRVAGLGKNGEKSPAAIEGMSGHDYYDIPAGLTDVVITSNAVEKPVHKPHVCLFTKDGTQLTGPPMPKQSTDRWTFIKNSANETGEMNATIWWNDGTESTILPILKNAGILDSTAVLNTDKRMQETDETFSIDGMTITMVAGQNEIGARLSHQEKVTKEIIHIDKTTSDFVFIIGGHNNPPDCNGYTLNIKAKMDDDFIEKYMQIMPVEINTLDDAQNSLKLIDNAIVQKDKVRAHLGALQNRFENTISNLEIQAENLQASESRISDVDVATEMTEFIRNQILTQTAVAMLAQANNLPLLAQQLLQ